MRRSVRVLAVVAFFALVAFAVAAFVACGSVSGGGDTVGHDASSDGGGAACDPAHDDCPSGEHCSSATHVCEAGCRADDGCPEAKPHCDVVHHACVVCLSSEQCPSGQACSDDTCVPSCDVTHPCTGGTQCCGGACVDVQTSAANCGACGSKCAPPNASGTCKSGTCAIGDCVDGFADCDGKVATGCEASVAADPLNCGKCGAKCSSVHGTATCVASTCSVTCDLGYADCDHDASNGCETDLAHDPKNCGACGASPAEICNGKDDNCNGLVDETFACVKGSGTKSCTTSCGSTGSETCSDTCTLSGCNPPAETCNLIDDDCNGRCDDTTGCRVGVDRSYNGTTGEHFYTTSASEASCCGFAIEYPNYYWLYTSGVAPGLTQLYRCYVASYGKHFYTTASDCEGNTVEGALGWIATSATCGAVPLYRLYRAANNDHFYTTSDGERDTAISTDGYVLESTVGYVWNASGG
jgi:hypothetical protein